MQTEPAALREAVRFAVTGGKGVSYYVTHTMRLIIRDSCYETHSYGLSAAVYGLNMIYSVGIGYGIRRRSTWR